MGESGPCGPCSEIYFDPNAFRSGTKSMVEVWNLVFMEYNEDSNQKKTPLTTKCIDTGMGLERLSMILQNKKSNYHTDLFLPLLEAVSQTTKTPYREETTDKKELTANSALRAIADHARAGVFLINDGVFPSNEKRGYVLRRILRRALYLGSTLTDYKPIFKDIAQSIIKNYHSVYPELNSQKEIILKSLQEEEEKFFHTLNQGKIILEKELFHLQKQNKKALPAETSFKLYDTYGFPFDLVQLICKQENIQVDQKGFEKKLEESRLKSKKMGFSGSIDNQKPSLKLQKESLTIKPNIPITKFIGYDQLESTSKIKALFDKNNSSISQLKAPCEALVVFDKTCFYAEGGGQIGDKGKLVSSSAKKSQLTIAQITDCQNIQDRYFHILSLTEGGATSR